MAKLGHSLIHESKILHVFIRVKHNSQNEGSIDG